MVDPFVYKYSLLPLQKKKKKKKNTREKRKKI